MRDVNLIDADYVYSVDAEIDGRWIKARPIGYSPISTRIRLAWGVFTGKYDALKWGGYQ